MSTFKFKDRVMVTTGFYEGQRGSIIKFSDAKITGGNTRYLLQTDAKDEIWVGGEELKKLKKATPNVTES